MLENAREVWEGNQKVTKELEVVQSKEGGCDTRILAAQQQCSSKCRIGHTLPENGERLVIKWQFKVYKIGDKRLLNNARKNGGDHFKRVKGPSSGIPQ